MWPLKKKSASSALPAEMQEYISAEKKEHVGLAWLLAFATLVATLVLSAGIFYGGKWVYKVAIKSTKNPTTSIKPQDKTPQQPDSAPAVSDEGNTQPITDEDTNGIELSDDEGVVSDKAVSTTASAQAKALAKTGPSNTIAIFVLVSVFSAICHNILVRRKLNS